MPIVKINLVAGRTQEQLRGIVRDVTKAVVKDTGCQDSDVHVILNEMQPDHYSVGGILKSDEK
ncbi:2-hydroxymuconate tautomerase [Lentilactobacillus senioris]|uniref:Tautomerase n=1 Tax=Lentilactobacillus senioris DSM 24302 = JCM 17472 TaxID=1423802 RepID=A0A0R2CR60_9LACO|nr:2-hydroxymuconate tautomerase [Lentilactobacillus senioris]KRM93829.1 hypothetical protein FC56_GL000548 [Lentilactobacillus senioris DSM 24302 = JCM 17472]